MRHHHRVNRRTRTYVNLAVVVMLIIAMLLGMSFRALITIGVIWWVINKAI